MEFTIFLGIIPHLIQPDLSFFRYSVSSMAVVVVIVLRVFEITILVDREGEMCEEDGRGREWHMLSNWCFQFI